MSGPPLISVVVPAHNAARFVAESIRSAQTQTYKHTEIIVVDDGSRDDTLQIAQNLAAHDSRVSVLQQPNLGVAAARNLAIRECRGDYIAPLDADDVWYPEKLERQLYQMIKGGASTGLVYSWHRQIDAEGASLSEGGRWRVEGNAYNPLVLQNFVGGGSVPLIRRACLDTVGLYDTSFRYHGGEGCEDWDLYLRIAEKYLFRVVPENLVKYRIHRESMSRNYDSMAQGRRLVLSGVKKRTTIVPEQILSWAEGKHCVIRLSTALRRRKYRTALGLTYEALRIDPSLLGAFFLEKSGTRLLDDMTPANRGNLGFWAFLNRPVSVLSQKRFYRAAVISPRAVASPAPVEEADEDDDRDEGLRRTSAK